MIVVVVGVAVIVAIGVMVAVFDVDVVFTVSEVSDAAKRRLVDCPRCSGSGSHIDQDSTGPNTFGAKSV